MRCLRRFFIVFLLLVVSFAGGANVAFSRDTDIHVIRDAEIEHYLHQLAAPIFKAAGIDPSSVTMVLLQSSAINAFVAGGMNEFFYTGLLQATDTPDQLLGVIAHETGHMAGGHLARGSEAMANASAEAIIGTLLGVAAGIAAKNGQVVMGSVMGAQQIAERNLLSYSRMQESSADTAGLSYLDKAGYSCQGMLAFMQKLAGQDILPLDRQIEYAQTHPLTQSRVDYVAHHLEGSPYANHPLPESFQQMHARMKAKLLGYLQPETALLRYSDKDKRADARYARAIALYRTHQVPRALALVDGLIAEEPQNAFLFELKAQILFENGKIDDAVALYQKTIALQPSESLLRVAYAHALLESKSPAAVDQAITQLLEANRLEARDPETWHFLAAAWGRKAEATNDVQYQGLVNYALAEQALAQGADQEGRQLAERALKVLPKSSPYWLRAQDIKLSVKSDRDKNRPENDGPPS